MMQFIFHKKHNENNRWRWGAAACILSAAVLAGCGDGTGEGMATLPEPAALPRTDFSATEASILNYELKYNTEEFTMEDYQALASLYGEQGLIRRQRDMLEQSYRLYEDAQAFETLQELFVNLEEETSVRQEAGVMLQNLETPGYLNEGIHMIESEEWFYAMMPKLGEGVRNYFLQEDGQVKLVIRTGYDGEGACFSTVWHHSENNGITVLKHGGGAVQVMETTLVDGAYSGPFTLWVLDSATGSILKEQGTFAEGAYTENYLLEIYRGDGEGDAFDLWNHRENMEYTRYEGQSGGQPDGMPAGQENVWQFAAALDFYPEFETYEAAESKEQPDEALPKVRIFDGQIQWLSGSVWITLGSVEQYSKEDPFWAYEWRRSQRTETGMQGGGFDIDSIISAVAAAPEPAQTPAATPKPAAQTPAATPKPAAQSPAATPKPATQTPAATPTPAPQPTPAPTVPPQDDDDDDGGSDNNGGGDGGSSDNGGADTGDSGNDVDIEWTDDIL